MSQVEFVAVLLALLHRHCVDAVPLNGESRAQMDSRLDRMTHNSKQVVTLQMEGVYGVSGDDGLKLCLSKRR